MRAGRLPIDEQLDHFRAALCANATLMRVLGLAAGLGLPDWYLLAGCLYQTVWNVVTGQPPESGILDYDLGYFDGSDLSWEAEDAVIQEGRAVFGGIAAPVQIRNQARVHLWYEQKFGVPCPAHRSSEARDRHVRGGLRLPGGAPRTRRVLADLRAARAVRRVQPGCAAQPGPGAPPRLPGQGGPVAAAVARPDRASLARRRAPAVAPAASA